MRGDFSYFPINIDTWFYAGIYFIVLLLSFLKRHSQISKQKNTLNQDGSVKIAVNIDGHNIDWRSYLFIGLECVYSSLGLVVLLIAAKPDVTGLILVAFVAVIIVSVAIERADNEYTDGQKFATNLVILAMVCAFTYYANQVVLAKNKSDQEQLKQTIAKLQQANQKVAASTAPRTPTLHDYRVYFPYQDNTLINQVGINSFGKRQLVYVVERKNESSEDGNCSRSCGELTRGDGVLDANLNQRGCERID